MEMHTNIHTHMHKYTFQKKNQISITGIDSLEMGAHTQGAFRGRQDTSTAITRQIKKSRSGWLRLNFKTNKKN